MPGISGGMLTDSAPAGELFIQATVRAGGAEGRFDDVVGTGWHLVTSRATDRSSTASWPPGSSRSGVASSPSAPTVEDVEGCYGRWFAEHGVVAVLERPDFAIYGTATTDQEVAGLLTRLRTQLEARPTSPAAS